MREMLVKQRTMLINTLRGLMAEFGIVVAEGPRHVGELVAILADPADARIPAPLHDGLMAIVESLRGLEQRIARVEKQIVGGGRDNATCRHLITIPGYGPILSSAMAAMIVNPAAFTSARHFAASLGLVASIAFHGLAPKLFPLISKDPGVLALGERLATEWRSGQLLLACGIALVAISGLIFVRFTMRGPRRRRQGPRWR